MYSVASLERNRELVVEFKSEIDKIMRDVERAISKLNTLEKDQLFLRCLNVRFSVRIEKGYFSEWIEILDLSGDEDYINYCIVTKMLRRVTPSLVGAFYKDHPFSDEFVRLKYPNKEVIVREWGRGLFSVGDFLLKVPIDPKGIADNVNEAILWIMHPEHPLCPVEFMDTESKILVMRKTEDVASIGDIYGLGYELPYNRLHLPPHVFVHNIEMDNDWGVLDGKIVLRNYPMNSF